ncbi:MAG: hypothetical protein JXA09_06485 [Anaerolineae bacterium]|nr:hypothetical protein [Anaerolineae bacterium]
MRSNDQEPIVRISCAGRAAPPAWAVRQRHLIELMDRAAVDFCQAYTRPDGTLIWRDAWPGMDGSDDAYESFVTFPLFYVVGGGEHVHQLARREWSALTWQFTGYGQVYREFDAYYDWMHHGESYTYLAYLALADPYQHMDRTRLLRFAAMYNGEDPEAPNWDAALKMIRSPINGSRGPRAEMTAEDWVTHRPILAHYLSPYEDVPGHACSDPLCVLDWTDDAVFAQILALMNERMVPGDVPLNLNATSLMTEAFLYTGEEKYRQWVLEYLAAWQERTARNGGIMPDNVGPSGEIGERMGGKWWGGYYGWRWPHGAWIILESTLIAGCNAMLLTGDPSWLDLHRSQADLQWSLREERDGQIVVPFRYGDAGWFDYRPLEGRHYVHLYHMTRSAADLARLRERFPDRSTWYDRPLRLGKAGHFWPEPWYGYLAGEHPGYPEQVLDDTYQGMCQRLDRIDGDDWSQVASWDVHHWQDLNPVIPEGLVQMTMGTPAAIYHGGLLHASVRYFDPAARRAGLPPGVAALVEAISEEGVRVRLVNVDPLAPRDVLLQAGAYGEHRFTEARVAGGGAPLAIGDRYLTVRLGPGAEARLDLGMARYANVPSYAFPPPLRPSSD